MLATDVSYRDGARLSIDNPRRSRRGQITAQKDAELEAFIAVSWKSPEKEGNRTVLQIARVDQASSGAQYLVITVARLHSPATASNRYRLSTSGIAVGRSPTTLIIHIALIQQRCKTPPTCVVEPYQATTQTARAGRPSVSARLRRQPLRSHANTGARARVHFGLLLHSCYCRSSTQSPLSGGTNRCVALFSTFSATEP